MLLQQDTFTRHTLGLFLQYPVCFRALSFVIHTRNADEPCSVEGLIVGGEVVRLGVGRVDGQV